MPLPELGVKDFTTMEYLNFPVHDLTSDTSDSFSCDLSPRCGEMTNFTEKRPLSLATKALNAVLRESENFELVKEANNQSSFLSRVDLDRIKVCKALNMFDDIYNTMYHQYQVKRKFEKSITNAGQIPVEAAMSARQQLKWFSTNERVVGALPGIKVGDQFRFQAQLVLIGLHCHYCVGIDYMKKDGKNVAISIVDSRRYANGKDPDQTSLNVFFYLGQSGNPDVSSSTWLKESEDQRFEGGNLALINSMVEKIPIRVIRKLHTSQETNITKRSGKVQAFLYDGLYIVSNYKQERGPLGELIFKFEFTRIRGQPPIVSKCLASTLDKSKSQHDPYVVHTDISQGKEKFPIRAFNDIDNEKPPPFKYVTEMLYTKKVDKMQSCQGCECLDGCSDDNPCSCLLKNGGEIPFNDEGAILRAKSIVYECGPSCKCPPSCKNRVSQNGVRYQLEIFKTKSKGWGVRSRDFIACGSFVCEYMGELVTEKEAEKRTNNDEYLFDIGKSSKRSDKNGFTIDAAEYGNVGRFINHSCSPNLYAQDVVYDHEDKRRAHLMLFASEDIHRLREFSFDYNYKIGQVRDAHGNIKIKKCFCGANDCIGRMY